MRKLFALLCIFGFAASAQAQTPAPAPRYLRIWEFVDLHTAAFDSSMAEFRAYLDTRPGYWTYSYYSGDNGHRYIAANLPNGYADIAKQDSITSAFYSALPNRDAFDKKWNAAWGSADELVWYSLPALSSPPTGMTSAQISAKYPYRRSTTRYVRPGHEAEFEAAIKDVKALDDRIGTNLPVAVYRLAFGANEPAYLFVTYAESSKSYWELAEARRVKREADPTYAGISGRISAAQRGAENVALTRNAKISYAAP